MKLPLFLPLLLFFLLMTGSRAQQYFIQEADTGFCSVDGMIMTSVAGYTGIGYADTDRGIGKSISWNINAKYSGMAYLQWRYGNGGGSGDRPAKLLINGQVVLDTVNFAHTGVWTNWTITDSTEVPLSPGSNNIRLEAYSVDGLGNYDYMIVSGADVVPAICTPQYVLNVVTNDPAAGSVTYEPVKDYYTEGTLVTVSASANPGYFFSSWYGDEPSANAQFSFEIKKNTEITARFLPNGTVMDPGLTGYATVQDDKGTPFLVTGGALGDTISAMTFEQLQQALADSLPHVVTLSGKLTGTGILKVTSNKTLVGVSDSAHIQGIEVEINSARNVIIRNLKISHVTPQDAIEINGGSQNIWIDHCELFSDRDHGTDYYDGLLDVKNESSFITVSWCVFRDHYKVSLISSGDQAVADTVTRITYHHNYFYNCESRLPSIRFGKAHIFNNYYKNCDTAINSRMNACVRVERNYFNNVRKAVMMEYSPVQGSVELIDNIFGSSSYSETPACQLEIPYDYSSFLDETMDIPIIVAGDVTQVEARDITPESFTLSHYPNPFNPVTNIVFSLPEQSHVTLEVYDIRGRLVSTLVNESMNPGTYTRSFDGSGLPSGLYFCRLTSDEKVMITKLVLIK